jgi:hypothetical protein
VNLLEKVDELKARSNATKAELEVSRAAAAGDRYEYCYPYIMSIRHLLLPNSLSSNIWTLLQWDWSVCMYLDLDSLLGRCIGWLCPQCDAWGLNGSLICSCLLPPLSFPHPHPPNTHSRITSLPSSPHPHPPHPQVRARQQAEQARRLEELQVKQVDLNQKYNSLEVRLGGGGGGGPLGWGGGNERRPEPLRQLASCTQLPQPQCVA